MYIYHVSARTPWADSLPTDVNLVGGEINLKYNMRYKKKKCNMDPKNSQRVNFMKC